MCFWVLVITVWTDTAVGRCIRVAEVAKHWMSNCRHQILSTVSEEIEPKKVHTTKKNVNFLQIIFLNLSLLFRFFFFLATKFTWLFKYKKWTSFWEPFFLFFFLSWRCFCCQLSLVVVLLVLLLLVEIVSS